MPQKLLKELNTLNPEHSFKCPNTINMHLQMKIWWSSKQNSFFNYGSVIYNITVSANAKWVTQNTVAYSLELDM